MYTKIKMYLILCLSFLLVGCANSMYFYETEKISLTVEARPDSSQPVQGSLGIKQRVVLVSPKKEDGEALSAISSFNFKIIPKSGTPFNPVLIQTAFVTGEAASQFTEPRAAADVAKAITISGTAIRSSNEEIACITEKARANNKLDELKQLVKSKGFEELSENDWNVLMSIVKNTCGILDKANYDSGLHKALQEEFNQ